MLWSLNLQTVTSAMAVKARKKSIDDDTRKRALNLDNLFLVAFTFELFRKACLVRLIRPLFWRKIDAWRLLQLRDCKRALGWWKLWSLMEADKAFQEY